MTLFNPGVTIRFVSALVFNGNAPGVFTDLDLSAETGARQSLVLLKVNNTSAGLQSYYVRTNGEALNGGEGGVAYAAINTGGNHTCWLLVATDANGVIEWLASGAPSTEITLEVIIQ